jgi:hypothetical protein
MENMSTQVYVSLRGEGVSVWRPVQASLVADGIYRILGPMVEGEDWEFTPGQLVVCEEQVFSSGQSGLVARRVISA